MFNSDDLLHIHTLTEMSFAMFTPPQEPPPSYPAEGTYLYPVNVPLREIIPKISISHNRDWATITLTTTNCNNQTIKNQWILIVYIQYVYTKVTLNKIHYRDNFSFY